MNHKGNKQWVWLAIDVKTREIVGVHIGDRLEIGAKALWQSLPPVYRQCAVCYTDFWAAYAAVLPSKRHQAVGKESGLTNRIERFNCTSESLAPGAKNVIAQLGVKRQGWAESALRIASKADRPSPHSPLPKTA